MKPNPYDVEEARAWLRCGCPVGAGAIEHIRTLLRVVALLPGYDALYQYGTEANRTASMQRQRELHGEAAPVKRLRG